MALSPVFVVVCALLVVAGAAKLRSPQRASGTLRPLGIGVPALVVRALGMLEVALGVAGLVSPTVVIAALVAVAYGIFCAFVVLLLRTAGGPTDCGCFGDADVDAGRTHVVLNGVACAIGVIAALSPPPGVGWILAHRPLIAVPLALGTLAAAFAAYVAFTTFPVAWRAYRGGAAR